MIAVGAFKETIDSGWLPSAGSNTVTGLGSESACNYLVKINHQHINTKYKLIISYKLYLITQTDELNDLPTTSNCI